MNVSVDLVQPLSVEVVSSCSVPAPVLVVGYLFARADYGIKKKTTYNIDILCIQCNVSQFQQARIANLSDSQPCQKALYKACP